MTPGDPFDELAGDSELEDAAGAAREDRRAEEDEYAHAAARQWARHRDLLDITRELQHRGDTVAMQVGESSFRGVIDAVGADYVQLRTPAGRVDVALRRRRLVVTGLRTQPLEQLVAVEPHLPPAGEPVARDLAVAHELAQVLDVHVEQLGCVGGGEDGRKTGSRVRLGWGHDRILP